MTTDGGLRETLVVALGGNALLPGKGLKYSLARAVTVYTTGEPLRGRRIKLKPTRRSKIEETRQGIGMALDTHPPSY